MKYSKEETRRQSLRDQLQSISDQWTDSETNTVRARESMRKIVLFAFSSTSTGLEPFPLSKAKQKKLAVFLLYFYLCIKVNGSMKGLGIMNMNDSQTNQFETT